MTIHFADGTSQASAGAGKILQVVNYNTHDPDATSVLPLIGFAPFILLLKILPL